MITRTEYVSLKNAGNILEAALVAFHQRYGHMTHLRPESAVEEGVTNLRIKLIEEEVNEELIPAIRKYAEATSRQKAEAAMEEILDGAIDSVYVIIGTLVTLGLPFGHGFAEVQRSNMSKTAPNPNQLMDHSKKYQVKTPKGSDFVAPDLKTVIQLAREKQID